MTDEREVVIVRWPGQAPSAEASESGLAALLAAYHLRTEAEKGEPVGDVDGLPLRYRAEISDPGAAFVGDVVLVALSGGAAVGCVVVTAPVGGRSEIKRLWTDPDFRGRGIASGLLRAALAQAVEGGVSRVRLSVWEWRVGAIALYERLGFVVVESWDGRDQLVCMECAV
ncbi:GNAT family N-acetyltransferase [Streptomyces sp. NBC_00459]|uniref:GNAT family N-acetyltransferase n=1 Tax=Streptomyces sp. NBC_00459 TaxID=2975749 RepID=UPI002E183F75